MLVELAHRPLQTRFGLFEEHLYYDGQKESVALVCGMVGGCTGVLCRVHSHCLGAHVFNSIECDCREQMETAQALIQAAGRGVAIWLDQEGRGNGHLALISAANTARESSVDQSAAYVMHGFLPDARRYSLAAEILSQLQVRSIVLMTNNPKKEEGLSAAGVVVTGTQPVVVDATRNPFLRRYYEERRRLGHLIPPG